MLHIVIQEEALEIYSSWELLQIPSFDLYGSPYRKIATAVQIRSSKIQKGCVCRILFFRRQILSYGFIASRRAFSQLYGEAWITRPEKHPRI